MEHGGVGLGLWEGPRWVLLGVEDLEAFGDLVLGVVDAVMIAFVRSLWCRVNFMVRKETRCLGRTSFMFEKEMWCLGRTFA